MTTRVEASARTELKHRTDTGLQVTARDHESVAGSAALPDFFIGRYELLGSLGYGGMGVVYRARDPERDAEVALKLMNAGDPDALYRFKREFRAHADVAHPNLVQLHELVLHDDRWFFTMEIIDGASIVRFVREGASEENTASVRNPREEVTTGDTQDGVDRSNALSNVPQLERLYSSMRQLAEGLRAVHTAGLLHRDVKPSNVLVTREGRTVLLDFGIATELGQQDAGEPVIGTPAYMSPEQAAGRPLSPASDFYSLGVVLYEVLCGRRPFKGHVRTILNAKQTGSPEPMGELPQMIPRDLVNLCTELLERNPADRPGGDEVISRLTPGAAPRGMAQLHSAPLPDYTAETLFVGREPERAMLHEAFQAVRNAEQRTVFVHGCSGIGKSALVQQFLDELEGVHGATVLRGRCYERESVPYKALDSLIDALSKFLSAMPGDKLRTCLPPDVGALVRLFPVFRQVEGIRRAAAAVEASIDIHALRRRAVKALRELLRLIAVRGPVVLHIDDVQWGDADSAALIAEVVGKRPSPPILLLATYRSEDTDRSQFLRMIRDSIPIKHIPIEPLTHEEACRLAKSVLERAQALEGFDIDRIARESGGSPFFTVELTRHLLEKRYQGDGTLQEQSSVTLDEVLRARRSELPEEVRRLLEVIAVAGRPIEQGFARRVASLADSNYRAMAQLRHRLMVRTHGARPTDSVEIYHDRIREQVVAALSEEDLRHWHGELARAIEAEESPDAEHMAVHLEGAGNYSRASEYCVRAAKQASDTLAFDRAAALYHRAIELRPPDRGDVSLNYALGASLTNAGRGAEAAAVYFAAAKGAQQADRLDLRRLAAEQLLRSGHIDEGLSALRDVLATINVRYPASEATLMGWVGWARLRVRLRGGRFTERDASELSPKELGRIDVLWSSASTLAMCDTLRGAYFSAQHHLISLKAGELDRVARALATEAIFASLWSERSRERARKLIDRANEIADRIDSPVARGYTVFASGLCLYQAGYWKESCEASGAALQVFRTQCEGVSYEIHAANSCTMWNYWQLGELRRFGAEAPALYEDGMRRGDLFIAADFGTGLMNAAWLFHDQVDRAEEIVSQVRKLWSPRGYQLQHYWSLMASSQIALYIDDPARAWSEVNHDWKLLWRSTQRRISQVRIEALYLRARTAIAAAAAGVDRQRALRVARQTARSLARDPVRNGKAMAALVEACVAGVVGDDDGAVALLARAERVCEQHCLHGYGRSAQRARGQLLGGDEGAAIVAEVDKWMTDERVVRPERVAAMLVPGFDRRGSHALPPPASTTDDND